MKTLKFTWKELKAFAETLTDEQLEQVVRFAPEEESLINIAPSMLDKDIYYNPDEPEDCGTIEELKECYYNPDDFKIENYQISLSKGTIYFSQIF